MSLLIRGGLLVTMNDRFDVVEGDVSIRDGRIAALLQAVRLEPGTLTARDAVWMATRGGARTLGLDRELGSLEPGKRADLIVVDREGVHQLPGDDPYSTLVYACRPTDVRTTIVDGRILVDEFAPVHLDRARIGAAAREMARSLVSRAGISS